MKTVITEVPTKVTKTLYACDHCPFNSPTPNAVKHHEFAKHQVKEQTLIGGIEFYWLDNQQDMDNLKNGLTSGYVNGVFKEAGWYGVEEDEYAGDDYGEYNIYIRTIDSFIDSWKCDIEQATGSIDFAQKLMNRVNK